MDVQTENLRLAMNYAEQKQDIIDALDKQIEKEREVFKTTVSANTENTRKLHDLLLKVTQGTWVDADTAALIADLKDRNLHLLRTNRALRGFVSFAGMDTNTLALAIQGQLDASSRPSFTNSCSFFPISSASKRSRHGSDDGSSDDSSEEKTPVPSSRGSRAGSAADAGEGSVAAASSLTPSRRGLHMPKAWKNKPKSKRQKTASRSQASPHSHFSQIPRRSTSRPPAPSPSVAHAKSPVSRPRSRSHSVSSHPTTSKSSAPSTSVPATPPKAEPLKDDQPPAVVDLTRDESNKDMEEETDAEVTRQSSLTPSAAPQRSNAASPSLSAPMPPADASPRAPTSYELDMQLLFGSDDDEDAPSGSKASREPVGLTTPYRSSSDEDTPSPPKRSDRTPISKPPSVPPSRSSHSSDSDEGGTRDASHDGDGASGDDSRDDEPSCDFPSGDTAGDEDIPPSTDVSRASAAVEGSFTGVPTTSSLGTSRSPESSPPVADSASREASARTPQASSPMPRVLTSPTSPRRHHPPPGSALSQTSLLPQESGPGRATVATYTSRRRRGDPDPPVPLPMTHQTVHGIRPALLPDDPFFFSMEGFDPLAPVSKRAPLETRIRRLWASFRGNGPMPDLGFALWERRFWTLAAAIGNGSTAEEAEPNCDKDLVKTKRARFRVLMGGRSSRADRPRNMFQLQYLKWSLESASSSQRSLICLEMNIEPSVPWYPVENLPFVPKTTDCLAEVPKLVD
ncbi:hypothetical protein F442_21511 [Phytophthora nicotianae P10297]|uniref:Uncharacterized protein n=1 Tax=Phytophthora nicotianae P10297 TaxID=1317064 RepID=W2Y3V4_PHYNI|nr:hypothetical protein F442_21511 [Phytophthora nicotianae P10297]